MHHTEKLLEIESQLNRTGTMDTGQEKTKEGTVNMGEAVEPGNNRQQMMYFLTLCKNQ